LISLTTTRNGYCFSQRLLRVKIISVVQGEIAKG
jgi:hypothetical protein